MSRMLTAALILILGTPAAIAAEKGRRVQVRGLAVGTSPVALDEAKLDALRNAVSQVCHTFINAQTETENFQLVRDKILAQPVGFARIVRIIGEPKIIGGELTEVRLEAEVFPATFEKRWVEFAHIKQREGNPRCVIVIAEDDNPHDNVPPVTNGLVQTELERFFLSKKVRLMDRGTSDAVRQRDLKLAAETGDLLKAAAAGAAFKADVVVLGNAEVRPGGTVELAGVTLKRWDATLTVRAVQTDAGAMLISKTYRPKRAMSTKTGTAKDALARLARDAAGDVLADIGEAWRERVTVGKVIEVTLQPLTRKQFKAIQAEMIKLKGIRGGRDGFRLRELVNQVATLDVTWKYNLDQLADRLEALAVPHDGRVLAFEVTELTANRFTARVSLKSMPRPPTTAPASKPGG